MGVKSNVQGVPIAPLKTALQYAGDDLGIDVATASYSEICEALAEAYPEFTGVIYDAGSAKVALDTTGYTVGTGFTSDGTWTLNASNMSAVVPSGESHYRIIGVADAIDLTDYSMLYVTSNKGTLSIDISGISGSRYISIWVCWAGATGWPRFYLSLGTSKSNMFNSSPSTYVNSGLSAGTTVTVSKIWLE